MREEELENIRKSMKSKNAKSRRKRNGAGRGGGPNGKAKNPAPPQPPASSTPPSSAPTPPPPTSGDDPSGVSNAAGGGRETGTENGHAAPSAATVVPPVSAGGALRGGDGAEGPKGGVRDPMDEVSTDFADSDDEIPLPDGVPVFRDLEEAMLVRELRRDRLPGKIIRSTDRSGNTVSFFFFVVLFVSAAIVLQSCLRA